jgi:hypothetical protein
MLMKKYVIMLLELKSWPETVGPFDTQEQALDWVALMPEADDRPWAVVETTREEGSKFSKISKVYELNLGPWKDMELVDPPRKSRPFNVPLN